LLFLRQGATIVVANRLFPFSMLEAIEQNPITFIYASPVHYFLLACSGQATPQSLADVRLAISTAMKMPEETLELFFRKFNFAPAEAYGIIEIGLPLMNTESSLESRRTVGRILPDYELRIADADSEGVGEVLIRGNGMFDAYFSPWRLRDECLRDGWFDTGDLGKLDSAGRLSLLGRSKTVIVSAGMKVFPEEVEETINSVPGVRESLVRGRAHPQYGQVPVAEVVLAGEATATVEQIRRHCFKRLSSYKVPVEFRIVQTLPKTASGKLARSAL
ncbi:MAG TPA: fatty acid--CoA ligase family protein, partial [Tepidisphaeraceae bacterium]|nr:fatty acid--CoA ligase family protein [Tepidisphaeraceae bacterium]